MAHHQDRSGKPSTIPKGPQILVTDYDEDIAAGKITAATGYGGPTTKVDENISSIRSSKRTVAFHPREDDEEPGQTAQEKRTKFHAHWRDLADRVKIHEMVKCLESEYEKLKILRDRTSWDELEKEKEIDALKFADTSSSTLGIIKEKKQHIMLMKTLKEEKDYLTAIYPSIKQAFGDPKYISQSAARIFKNRANLTEEEVEKVMNLCEDKVEQRSLRDILNEKRFREKYLQNASERRRMMYDFINSKFFTQFMLMTIILSVIGLLLLTFEGIYIRYGFPLTIMDSCIIGIFLVEAILKISIYKEDYFKRMWNILDMLIILTHFVDVLVDLITKTMALSSDINASIYFKGLKSLRALRLLRVIKFLPNLQVILSTVFESFLSLGSIAVLMLLFIFVFAVMGKGLFSEHSPRNFGTVFLALVTLFQLLTLDDWYELLDEKHVDRKSKPFQYWIMFFYLFAYLILEYFVFLNLFVAVLVDNFQLSLAEAEFKRQRESLDFGTDSGKFEIMEEEGEGLEGISEKDRKRAMELRVEDYFAATPGSREHALLGELMKDLASVDFEGFMWNRRSAILNNVLDRALMGQTYSWSPIGEDKEQLQIVTPTAATTATPNPATAAKPAPAK